MRRQVLDLLRPVVRLGEAEAADARFDAELVERLRVRVCGETEAPLDEASWEPTEPDLPRVEDIPGLESQALGGGFGTGLVGEELGLPEALAMLSLLGALAMLLLLLGDMPSRARFGWDAVTWLVGLCEDGD